ncbi:MAG TPA: aminotransferase class IV, partial [Pseudonocardiaceae bacterium]|nr:aminotransferase class IV [Pseudonocardiaceae bacterium]
EPSIAELRHLALHSYGNFTAMQVRDGAVRGLDLHLARLRGATGEMFGVDLDGVMIRDRIRHAIHKHPDGSVRTAVVAAPDGEVSLLVTVRAPGGVSPTPLSVRSVPYQRPLAHLKQVGGGFGQVYYHDRTAGYDEILLTGPDGVISEGGITNVGFFDGTTVVWPSAPRLAGVTMGLLEPRLPSRRETVRLADIGRYTTVFATNSRGVVPVGSVDDVPLPVDDGFMATVVKTYETVPWDPI